MGSQVQSRGFQSEFDLPRIEDVSIY